MDSKRFTKEIIGKLESGVSKFVIYPYGTHGREVENLLKKCFDIIPEYIADNTLCKYNQRIISGEEIENVFSEDMIIILTVENSEINTILKKQLLQFVDEENIFNVFQPKEENLESKDFVSEYEKIRKSIRPSRLIKTKNRSVKRIKVRMISTQQGIMDSLLDALISDGNFDIMIIVEYLANLEGVRNDEKFCYAKEKGVRCCNWTEYRPREDRPDVVICFDPYMTTTYLGDIHEYAKLVVCVPIQLIRYTHTKDEFWKLFHKGFDKYEPDFFLFDSLMYNEIKESPWFDEKFIEMGNPKFDGIYNELHKKEKEVPYGWEKLKRKKVILYTTDHNYTPDGGHENVTFDKYAETIFDYAYENEDIAVIFRPHKNMIRELLRYNYWSEDDFEEFKEKCWNSKNIVYDKRDTYDYAFSVADGIITDPFCGIICSALPTLKPICVVYRDKSDISYHPGLTDCYHNAYSKEDLLAFMEKIKSCRDDTFDARKECFDKYIKSFDGKNGQRIVNFIKEKLYER